ncbi:MAG: YdcF family protein [Coxiellaceae bacterium]|jgi:uncharacterized SAM-binding protein YcdF (DUF218 family)|nr:YdcF family protein [Coxiellaceae bacterium]
MIYLHKILPLLFLPTAIILYLLLWAIITRKRLAIILAATILTVTSLPVSYKILMRYVENYAIKRLPANISNADAIVVLSGMLVTVNSTHGLVSEWADGGPNRFFAGIELLKAKKAKYLILTGGKSPQQPDSPPEGEVLAQYAQNFGIKKNQIIVTGEVQNTYDEAKAIKEIVLIRKFHKIILVTSAFHMPRAVLLFKQFGIYNIEPYPVDFRVGVENSTLIDFLPSGFSLGRFEFALRELIGVVYYCLKFKI